VCALGLNDFQSWKDQADDAVVRAVALGIRCADPAALQTVELDYRRSASRSDLRWRGIIKLDAAYTYFATYAKALQEYKRRPPVPVFLLEVGYEFEQNAPSISYGDPQTLRGNHYTWQFADGWKRRLDTEGSAQLGTSSTSWRAALGSDSSRITGTESSRRDTEPSPRTAASPRAITSPPPQPPDGKLAISYLPEGGTIRVDTKRMAGRVLARWYDRTSGRYTRLKGSPFTARRSLNLTAPGRNHGKDRDWVLVLTTP
jgi:hypothetical protein